MQGRTVIQPPVASLYGPLLPAPVPAFIQSPVQHDPLSPQPMEIYPVTRPTSPAAQASPGRSQHLHFLRGQLATLFNVPLPPLSPDRSAPSMGTNPKLSLQSREDMYKRFAVRSSPPDPSIPTTRPRSPVSDRLSQRPDKRSNTDDYKDPSHPVFLTMQWRHVPKEDRPPVRSLINIERCAASKASSSMGTSPQSNTQSPQSAGVPEGDAPAPINITKNDVGVPEGYLG